LISNLILLHDWAAKSISLGNDTNRSSVLQWLSVNCEGGPMVDDYEASRISQPGWYGLYGPVVSPLDVWQAERLAEQAEQLDARITKDRKQHAAGRRSFDKRLAADRAQSGQQQRDLDKRLAADRQNLAGSAATAPTTSSSPEPAQTMASQADPAGPPVSADPPDHIPPWERSGLLLPAHPDAAGAQRPATPKGSGGSDVA
jgi:hypothetical protein